MAFLKWNMVQPFLKKTGKGKISAHVHLPTFFNFGASDSERFEMWIRHKIDTSNFLAKTNWSWLELYKVLKIEC